MTVSSATTRKTFAGNGSTVSFGTSPVVFFDSTDLAVYVVNDTTGVVETLVETTDYTVSGGDGSTGTISTSGLYGAPASGETLVISRTVPYTQASDFVNNDGSDAEVLEDALDKLTMLAQQNSVALARAVRQPDSDATALSALPGSVSRASKYLAFDADGDVVASEGLDSLDPIVTQLAVLRNVSAATTDSDYNLNLNRLVTNPTDAKPYDALAAGQITVTGTAVLNGGGVLSVPTARVVYAGITSNFNGATSETSAVSGFNNITDTGLTLPPIIWGAEFHCTKYAGVADSQMICLELGMHKGPAYNTSYPAVGLLCNSIDFSGVTATRAGDAIRIQGGAGWTDAIRYFDTDNSTQLFGVSQTGLIYTNGGLQVAGGQIAVGSTPSTAASVLVNGSMTTGVSQAGVNSNPTISSAGTSTGVGVQAKIASAAASFTMTSAIGFYSSAHTKGAGSTITTAYGAYFETQTVGASNLLIGSAAGATLTTAGVWTDAPSWARLKDVKRRVSPVMADEWLAWLRDDYSAVQYRYHGKTGGAIDPKDNNDHTGFILDEVPQEIRDVLCVNDEGGVSGKDVDGFLLTVVQALARKVAELEKPWWRRLWEGFMVPA